MAVPVLPDPPPNLPPEIRRYLHDLLSRLRLYFEYAEKPSSIGAANIELPYERFPTEANLADLRQGMVYRDSTAGSVLKVKTGAFILSHGKLTAGSATVDGTATRST